MKPDIDGLYQDIGRLIETARIGSARNVNAIQVLTNFEIGRRIVEHEQKGSATAEYGKRVLEALADRLSERYGRGFSSRYLLWFRRFYLEYRDRVTAQQLEMKDVDGEPAISKSLISKLATPLGDSGRGAPFPALGWTHYICLMKVADVDARSFYEIEAAREGWSVRELERQIGSSLYERLLLSRNKDEVKRLALEGQRLEKPADLLKEPYVLEFLGLEERDAYTESALESRIIDKLEHFLLELGKGFLFEARQKRFTFDEEHFFVDLVFYNRLLRCHVLVDLKTGKLTHQDLGQMLMYVNYFNRHVRTGFENPTVGIILCRQKNDAIVEITLPEGSNIHASEYQTYLPDREELRRRLVQWSEEQENLTETREETP